MKISKLIKILMISLIIFMQPTFVKAETIIKRDINRWRNNESGI